jgi:DNA polymerase III subunit delta'
VKHQEMEGRAEGGEPTPRANPALIGHETVERELRRLFEASRLPHAILLAGPRGIGKATLAFRLARFILARRISPIGETGLAIDPDSGVFRRVAAAGHADLLTIERDWDPQRRRRRSEITAEQTREIAGFLHLTAAEEGWRIVIVDGAEEMNRNAANAVLKILEEPPRCSLLLLVSHNPGVLLPTIRSRCRSFRLEPLAPALVTALLGQYRAQLDKAEAAGLSILSGGSIGRALDLADGGGFSLYGSLVEILSQGARLDMRRLHAFVDGLSGAEGDSAYQVVGELLSHCLARIARVAAACAQRNHGADQGLAMEAGTIEELGRGSDPVRWVRLRQEIDGNFAMVRELNLDRKQAMLSAFFAIADSAR